MTMEKQPFIDVFLLNMVIFHGDQLVYCRVARFFVFSIPFMVKYTTQDTAILCSEAQKSAKN